MLNFAKIGAMAYRTAGALFIFNYSKKSVDM
jgi:hypothetical protein